MADVTVKVARFEHESGTKVYELVLITIGRTSALIRRWGKASPTFFTKGEEGQWKIKHSDGLLGAEFNEEYQTRRNRGYHEVTVSVPLCDTVGIPFSNRELAVRLSKSGYGAMKRASAIFNGFGIDGMALLAGGPEVAIEGEAISGWPFAKPKAEVEPKPEPKRSAAWGTW